MIYLLYGEDNFLKNQFLKKLKKKFEKLELGINYILMDENNVQDLISNIETPAFGYDSKLIIVRDSDLFTKKNPTADVIAEYIKENEIVDTELIFVEQKAEKNSLYNVIAKKGEVKEFKELNIPELINQIKRISNAYNVKINNQNAQYFIECAGTNMQDIINELRKLIEYEGNGGEIKKEDIDALTIKKSSSIIFDLTDSLGKRDTKKALNVLHDLENNREPVQVIIIMLYRHFKKLYIVKLSDRNNLIENLNLKPNQTFLTRKYITQANYFTKEELRRILDDLIRLDEDSKNGNIDLNIGLEAILCRI